MQGKYFLLQAFKVHADSTMLIIYSANKITNIIELLKNYLLMSLESLNIKCSTNAML